MPGGQGPKTVKGAQSDPNYVSRLLLDCVPVRHKVINPAYLLYRSYRMFAGGGAKIIVTPLPVNSNKWVASDSDAMDHYKRFV